MYGVVSLLDPLHTSLVHRLWRELEEVCRLASMITTRIPHFSWHIAEAYDMPRLQGILQETASDVPPFKVRAAGLGEFHSLSRVLYLSIAKDERLNVLHKMLWERLKAVARMPSPHYHPEMWVPHITLAHGDLSSEWMECAQDFLADQPLNWEIMVDNLAIGSQLDNQPGRILKKFPLCRKS